MFISYFKEKYKELATKSDLLRFRTDLIKTQVTCGRILGEFNLVNKLKLIRSDIQKAEFQVFSQWGDDGIIHFLTNYLDIPKKTFIEFGVENYTECNTRFLLMNSNWSGLVLDGSESNINAIKADEISWRHDLMSICAFVTAENINDLISRKFVGEIGLLHVDIDGNDYWVWKAISVVNPIILVIEYNSIFGPDKPWTVPYDPDFVRSKMHHSNLFYGTSILSACDLAKEKGYSFIGCNSNGNNAYFVRDDKVADVKVLQPQEGFVLSKFSESRDENGTLSFLRGEDRRLAIRGQNVFNTRTKTTESIL